MLIYVFPFLIIAPLIVAFCYSMFSIGGTEDSEDRRWECLRTLMLITPCMQQWMNSFVAYRDGDEDFSRMKLAFWSILLLFGYFCGGKTILYNVREERLARIDRERIADAG